VCGISAWLPANATESTELLDNFSNLTLETPSRLHQQWEQRDSLGLDSTTFRQHYQREFQIYADMAKRLALRTRACATGELPQASGYSPSLDLGATLESMQGTLDKTENLVSTWVRSADESARLELGQTIPRLTTGFARILFELSNCSGYLYGDPVN